MALCGASSKDRTDTIYRRYFSLYHIGTGANPNKWRCSTKEKNKKKTNQHNQQNLAYVNVNQFILTKNVG